MVTQQRQQAGYIGANRFIELCPVLAVLSLSTRLLADCRLTDVYLLLCFHLPSVDLPLVDSPFTVPRPGFHVGLPLVDFPFTSCAACPSWIPPTPTPPSTRPRS